MTRSYFNVASVLAVCAAIGACANLGESNSTSAGVENLEAAAADRPTAPDVTITADVVAARRDLGALIDDLSASAADPARPLHDATAAEIDTIAERTRAATPGEVRFAWRRELERAAREAGEPPTVTQEAALTRLDAEALSSLQVRWNDPRGTPIRLEGLGFVRRDLDAAAVWRAFATNHATELRDLFGITAVNDELALEETPSVSPFQVVRLSRRIEGVAVGGEGLDVYVTTDEAAVGAGVIWRIEASWTRNAAMRFRVLPTPGRWIPEATARRAAPAETAPLARKQIDCLATCVAYWSIEDRDRVARVDGLDGTVLADWNPTAPASGAITLGSYPPGATSITPVRYRGAAFTFAGSPAGYASLADGTYTYTGSEPLTIDHIGAQTTSGAWPLGRVDRRPIATYACGSAVNWAGTPGGTPLTWTPSTQSNRDFTSSWPADPFPGTTFRNTSQIVYGWLSYWQYAAKNVALVGQVADTVSYAITPCGSGGGRKGAQTGSGDSPAPGSGQATWQTIGLSWGPTDTVGNAMVDSSYVLHELGHGFINCAAGAGASCFNNDPVNGTYPLDPSLWRNSVYQAAGKENGASFLGAVMTEFRSTDNGSGGNIQYSSAWNYGGFFSTTDSFGSVMQDSQPSYSADCNASPSICSPGYGCDTTAGNSPVQFGGICVKQCTFTSDCTPGLICSGNLCRESSYSSNWMLNVGTRLVFDRGWASGMKMYLDANAGDYQNGLRDFDVGSDNWYDKLVLASSASRYETTRAVWSVSQAGRTLPVYDDITSVFENAQPIAVVRTNPNGTPIWWGNGVSAYPNFEDWLDVDNVLFRGVAGQAYNLHAERYPLSGGSSTADLQITVTPFAPPGAPILVSGYLPSGPSADVSTGILASTGWYVATFGTRGATSGAWQGRIELTLGSDEYATTNADAYPSPGGVTTSGILETTADSDRFETYVPSVSSTLTISATPTGGGPALTIDIYWPSGSLYGTYAGSKTIPAADVSFGGAGWWRWGVRGTATAPRAYTTIATLACAATDCDNVSTPIDLPVAQTWGDRVGGRLEPGWNTTYQVTLAAQQHVSYAVVDRYLGSGADACEVQVDLKAPTAMTMFQGQQVTSFRSGPAAANPTGTNATGSGGGHFIAPTAGTYQFTLSNYKLSTNCWYRFFVATDPSRIGTTRPAW